MRRDRKLGANLAEIFETENDTFSSLKIWADLKECFELKSQRIISNELSIAVRNCNYIWPISRNTKNIGQNAEIFYLGEALHSTQASMKMILTQKCSKKNKNRFQKRID